MRLSSTKMRKDESGFTLTELMIATTIFSTILLLITLGLLSIGKNYYKGRNTARTQDVARRVIDEITQAIQYGEGSPGPEEEPPTWDPALGTPPTVIRRYHVSTPAPPTPPTVNKEFEDTNFENETIEDYFCIGPKRFTFGNKRVRSVKGTDPAQHGLVVDEPAGGCNAGLAPNPLKPAIGVPLVGRELLAENTRLTELKIIKRGSGYTITVQISTGEQEFIMNSKPGTPGNPNNIPYGSCRPGSGQQYCAVSRLETTVQRRRND